MPILQLQHVTFCYPDGYRAINDVSLLLENSETLGVVGANGAGKSTLLLILPGIHMPTAGSVSINGTTLSKKTVQAVRKDVGLIFQEPDDQLFTPTVYEDIAFGPRNMGFSDDDVQTAVNRALALVGIERLAQRAPYKLSGGEKRLAAMAAVLAMGPALLVMDEPSASLDPKARRNLIELLPKLLQAKIVASHDLDMIWDICDRVIVLKNGEVAAEGETKMVLSDKALLESCGLELPLRLTMC